MVGVDPLINESRLLDTLFEIHVGLRADEGQYGYDGKVGD